MEYRCVRCHRVIPIEDEIKFCPYCGVRLTEDVSSDVIDRIWGDVAKRKSAYKERVSDAIRAINLRFRDIVQGYAAKKGISFGYEYTKISFCERKDDVLKRTGTLMERLHGKIAAMQEAGENDLMEDSDVLELERRAKAILSELEEPIPDTIFVLKDRKERVYEKSVLSDYYELLQGAYRKYVRCVENNDIFSAFPADSDFGSIGSLGRRHFANGEGVQWESEEFVDLEQETQTLLASLQQPYERGLDEDTLPHVDAFWRGIRVLCCCIATNEKESWKTIFDEYYVAYLFRKIDVNAFSVTEERIRTMESILNNEGK